MNPRWSRPEQASRWEKGPALATARAFLRDFLAGWTVGAQEFLQEDRHLTHGVAIDAFRIGYRAALRAAWGE